MFPGHIPSMILTGVHLLGKYNSIILKFHAFKRSIQILRHVGQSLCTNLLTSLNIHKRNRFTDCLSLILNIYLMSVYKKVVIVEGVDLYFSSSRIDRKPVLYVVLQLPVNTEINQLSITNRNQRHYCTSSSKKILAVEFLAISHPFTNSQLQQINLKKRK